MPSTSLICNNLHHVFHPFLSLKISGEILGETFNTEIPAGGLTKVTSPTHCESHLALYLAQLQASKYGCIKFVTEIGVSKRTCVCCKEFLKIISTFYKWTPPTEGEFGREAFQLSGYHRKRPSCWKLPPNTPPSLVKDFADIIQGEVRRIGEMASRRIREDSDPLSSDTIGPCEFRVPLDGVYNVCLILVFIFRDDEHKIADYTYLR